MKIIACLLFLWGCQPKVIFTTEMAKITTQMSENVHEERGLCLKYAEIGDTMVIYDYTIPVTYTTGLHSIFSLSCPDDYPITWHTHNALSVISTSLQEYYVSATGTTISSADQLVYLSSEDIKYALYYRPEYMMVQVSGGRYAWWHISQIEEGRIQLPINSQLHLEK